MQLQTSFINDSFNDEFKLLLNKLITKKLIIDEYDIRENSWLTYKKVVPILSSYFYTIQALSIQLTRKMEKYFARSALSLNQPSP